MLSNSSDSEEISHHPCLCTSSPSLSHSYPTHHLHSHPTHHLHSCPTHHCLPVICCLLSSVPLHYASWHLLVASSVSSSFSFTAGTSVSVIPSAIVHCILKWNVVSIWLCLSTGQNFLNLEMLQPEKQLCLLLIIVHFSVLWLLFLLLLFLPSCFYIIPFFCCVFDNLFITLMLFHILIFLIKNFYGIFLLLSLLSPFLPLLLFSHCIFFSLIVPLSICFVLPYPSWNSLFFLFQSCNKITFSHLAIHSYLHYNYFQHSDWGLPFWDLTS